MSYERLDLTGLNLTDTSLDYEGAILEADFGSGYKATAIVALSVREWTLAADVLVDLEDPELMIDGGEHGPQTRLRYLWEFYRRRMDLGCEPFWVRDQLEARDYLVEFLDRRLTLDVFTSVVFATGLVLRQRRVQGVGGVGAVTAEENPDQI